MKALTLNDARLIRDVTERWGILSANRKAEDCTSDVCHTEYDAMLELADRIQAGVCDLATGGINR
jgi:hypothetical protein